VSIVIVLMPMPILAWIGICRLTWILIRIGIETMPPVHKEGFGTLLSIDPDLYLKMTWKRPAIKKVPK
jgi:hypothetical protein